jgi:hypothetical protein
VFLVLYKKEGQNQGLSPSCLSCRRRPEEEGRRLRSESAGWRSFLARIRYRMRRTINLGISTFRASTHICASGIAPPLRKQASLFVLATGTQCARRAQLDPRPLVTYLKASRYTACQGRMETRRAAAVVGGTAGTESASAPAPASRALSGAPSPFRVLVYPFPLSHPSFSNI